MGNVLDVVPVLAHLLLPSVDVAGVGLGLHDKVAVEPELDAKVSRAWVLRPEGDAHYPVGVGVVFRFYCHPSSPGRYVVLPERRDVVPILGEEEVLEVRVTREVHPQHLVRLPLVILGAGPHIDESWNRWIVSLGPLGEGDNYRFLAGLRHGPYEVDDLDLVLRNPVGPGDAADVVEPELVPDEESNLLDFLRSRRHLQPLFANVVDSGLGELLKNRIC